jgi:phosphopentomutase
MGRLERAIVLVLDGVGVGQAPDAADYGDEGANCLANCARAIGGLTLPTLARFGLGTLTNIAGTPPHVPMGACGRLIERSPGKDSTTGHWELMGVVLERPMATYPSGFPLALVAEFERLIGRRVLGNKPASGTAIIEELGPEHLRTGSPILYTSADSVFQLAAHEDVIAPADLYHLCEIARGLLTGENAVGRVIARPFIGSPGTFSRTPRRRDFSLPPPTPTVLDALKESGREVVGIGKIEDLFAGHGLTSSNHTATNAEAQAATLEQLARPYSGMLFVNLVECDQNFGHRRNPQGYADALRAFDAWLPAALRLLGDDDTLFITGDHGTDPTWRGTDHTRESVPLLAVGKAITPDTNLGVRASFADLGATLADAFALPSPGNGQSFAREIGLSE